MMNFLLYEGKVAVLSFVLPLCVITIHKQVEMETIVMEPCPLFPS